MAEEKSRWLGAPAAVEEVLLQFPAVMSGNSYLPVIPVPGDPVPSPRFHGHLLSHAYTHTQIHTCISKENLKSLREWVQS